MLSRVANSIFWMSRYVERAENVARFIDVNFNISLDLGGHLEGQWAPLVYTTGDHEIFAQRYGTATQANVIQFLTFDVQNPNSILSCLAAARENARTVREMLSSSMWEELNKFYLMVREAANDAPSVVDSPFDFFSHVKACAYLLEGVTEATMSRGEAWHFRRLSRMLERADKTSRILDVKYFLLLPSVQDVGTPLDTIQWASLLRSASALEMYRQAHGRITPERVVQFLILNRDFPRAIQFCLINAEHSLLSITGGTTGTYCNPAEQRLGKLRAELDYTDIAEVIEQGMHEFIDDLQRRMNSVGEAVQETFFAISTPTSKSVPLPTAGSQSQVQQANA